MEAAAPGRRYACKVAMAWLSYRWRVSDCMLMCVNCYIYYIYDGKLPAGQPSGLRPNCPVQITAIYT